MSVSEFERVHGCDDPDVYPGLYICLTTWTDPDGAQRVVITGDGGTPDEALAETAWQRDCTWPTGGQDAVFLIVRDAPSPRELAAARAKVARLTKSARACQPTDPSSNVVAVPPIADDVKVALAAATLRLRALEAAAAWEMPELAVDCVEGCTRCDRWLEIEPGPWDREVPQVWERLKQTDRHLVRALDNADARAAAAISRLRKALIAKLERCRRLDKLHAGFALRGTPNAYLARAQLTNADVVRAEQARIDLAAARVAMVDACAAADVAMKAYVMAMAVDGDRHSSEAPESA